jgi:hypothetical protein
MWFSWRLGEKRFSLQTIHGAPRACRVSSSGAFKNIFSPSIGPVCRLVSEGTNSRRNVLCFQWAVSEFFRRRQERQEKQWKRVSGVFAAWRDWTIAKNKHFLAKGAEAQRTAKKTVRHLFSGGRGATTQEKIAGSPRVSGLPHRIEFCAGRQLGLGAKRRRGPTWCAASCREDSSSSVSIPLIQNS